MYSIAICTFVEGTGDHGLPVVASSLLTASHLYLLSTGLKKEGKGLQQVLLSLDLTAAATDPY